MKIATMLRSSAFWLFCICLHFPMLADAGIPVDTSFTYQGELRDGGVAANGNFDIDVALFDQVAGGSQLGVTQSFMDVIVTDGIFTIVIDFGSDPFSTAPRWLEIAVEGTTLTPRQPLTRTPYSIQTRGIFVDDAGNVGIKTNNPTVSLQVGEGHDNAQIHLGAQPQLTLSKDTDEDKFRVQITGSGYGGNVLQLGRDDGTHDVVISADTLVTETLKVGPQQIEPPIAYGSFEANGDIIARTSNLDIAWNGLTTNALYIITVDEFLLDSGYTVLVTPQSANRIPYVFDNGGGTLGLRFRDGSDFPRTSKFSIMVFPPPNL